MGNEKPKETHVQDGYNQTPITQAVADLQKSFNPEPISQTISQLPQGDGGNAPSGQTAPTPPPSNAQEGGAGQQQ